MRFASYNIMSGGFSSYSYDTPRPERLELIKKAVSMFHADLVSLVDTFRWDEIFSADEIASMFGYKNAYCINLNDDRLRKKGHNNGITVMSNLGGTQFETISLGSRDAVRTSINIEGKHLDIYSIYLDDLSEDSRLLQLSQLLGQIRPGNTSVLMGDFNTLSKNDLPQTDPQINNFYAKNPSLLQSYEHILADMKRGEVISTLEINGFVDASKSPTPTAPTKLFPAVVTEPFLRLDYAFIKGEMRAKNFRVMSDAIFAESSDHYPIVLELAPSLV